MAVHCTHLHRTPFVALAIVIGASVACTQDARQTGPLDVDTATAAIAAHLPSQWNIAARADGQVPQGHYWGDWGRDYRGLRGRHLVVLGPGAVSMHWRDNGGASRSDPIGRESLDIWIMPGAYREGFWSRVNPEAPKHAAIVVDRDDVRVFAMASHTVVDQLRFEQILTGAIETNWPDSPDRTGDLSWPTWSADLRRALTAPSNHLTGG